MVIDKPGGTLTLASGTDPAHQPQLDLHGRPGGLAAAGSTLVFAGGTITGTHTLDAIEIRGGTVTIAAGTTLTVAGTLNLFSGTLNQRPTGTLAAQGDIDAQIGFTGGGTATLLINGSGAQTFTGFHTAATGALPNLVSPSRRAR